MDKMARKRALERLGYVFLSGWVSAGKAKQIFEDLRAETKEAEERLRQWQDTQDGR